jgi:hypothetical protein
MRSRLATPYVLDCREDRMPMGTRFSTPVHTGPKAHTASYAMGIVFISRG